MLTARFWRSRRAAALAGIVFAVLLITAMTMMRIALSEGSLQSLQGDASRRALIESASPGPVCRHRLLVVHRGHPRAGWRGVEDRLFSTVFLGSGLLFVAMMFRGRLPRPALMEMLAGPNVNADIWTFNRSSTQALISVYAMRMAAVFTLSVSTLGLHLGHPALGLLPRVRRRPGALVRRWRAQVVPAPVPAWVLVVSLVILFTRPPARPSVPEKTRPAHRAATLPAGLGDEND